MATRADNLAWLYDGLRSIDTVVAKALGVSEQAQSAKIEARLRAYINAQWEDLSARAVRLSSSMIRKGSGDVVQEGDVERAVATVDSTMEQWSGRVTGKFTADMRETYGLGRTSGMNRAMGLEEDELVYNTPPFSSKEPVEKASPALATLKPSFDLVDEAALDAFESHQVFWIGKHYKDNVSPIIAAGAKTQITAGMSRADAGRLMEKLVKQGLQKVKTPGGFNGTSRQYFEGLVANASTVARSTGHLRSFQKVGYTVYAVVNPNDHRTCEICNLMDGKEFKVSDGADLMGGVVGAKTPNQVKKAHPWLTPKKAHALTGGKVGPAGVGQTKGLAKAGHSMPPYHYKCRCDIDITKESEIIPFETNIGGGPKPATPKFNPALKLPKKQQLKKPPVPKPVPPPPVEQSTAVAPAEFPWKASQLKKTNKTFAGAHRKWSYTDPNGDEWLFKPVGEEFRAYGDKVAEQIAKATGVPHAELHVVTIDGQAGSIQKLYKNVRSDLRPNGLMSLDTLDSVQVGQVQREHAFDWLIGNHDGHGGNLLIQGGGNDVVGIDKGQLFKFYNKDSLAFSYNPNKRFGETSYYNIEFDRYAKGKLKKGFAIDYEAKALQDFLKAVEDMPEEDFLAMIKPYSHRAVKARRGAFGKWGEKRFLDEALRRKRDLRKQIKAVYDEMERVRTGAAPVVEAVAEAAPSKAVTPINAQYVKQARDAKWAGKAVFVAGDDFEGMQFLTYGTNKSTFIETKLRTAGDKKFLAFVKRTVGEEVEHHDSHWDRILRYAKSVNKHMGPGGDKKIPGGTKALGKQLASMYVNVDASTVSVGQRTQFEYYKKELGKLLSTSGNPKKSGIGKTLVQYKPPSRNVGALSKDAPKVTKVSTFKEGGKSLRAGEILEEAGVGNSFQGEAYEVDFGGGIKAVYVRHGDGNKFSKQGKLRLILDKDISKVTAKDIDGAMKQLKRLGLPVKLADPDDLELLYLIKVTEAANLADNAAFVPTGGASVKQNIKKLKGAWEKKLGKKLTKAMGYEPMPESEFLDGSGWGSWRRFDIDVEALVRRDVGIYHNLHGGIPDLKKILNSKTGGLISTEEKYRLGVVPRGMSPGQDQSTGGASYVFGRLRTTKTGAGQIRFHPEILRDPDAIMYREDLFGKVHKETIKRNRQYGQGKMIDIAEHGQSNNEVIFKNTASFERYLDEVKADSAAQRLEIIKLFRKAGITRVGPNKKRIEDAVVTVRRRLR